MPDKMFLQNFFAQTMGYLMDFDNPQTFNEKLHWLKLYDRKPIYTQYVDKYQSKEWVDLLVGGAKIPTIAVYDKVSDIDYDKLPNRFVMKCTHDSGSVVVCSDKKKLNIESANAILNKGMAQDYYILGREWPYRNVPHRILVEEYLEDSQTHEARDYKFFCFGGKVKCFKIDFGRANDHRANYYDAEGNILPFGECVCPPDYEAIIEIPGNINQMIGVAEKIASNIDCCFERIDLYNINGRIYFGEITFFPGGGHMKLTNPEWDKILGSWIDLKYVMQK